jgi:hypothetical protein
MCSRRSFMRVAAASGGAGLLSAGLLPTIVEARVGSPSQVVLPLATPGIAPFKVHVPQQMLEDLKKRLGDTRWPDKEPVSDWSQACRSRKRKRWLNIGALSTTGVVLKEH